LARGLAGSQDDDQFLEGHELPVPIIPVPHLHPEPGHPRDEVLVEGYLPQGRDALGRRHFDDHFGPPEGAAVLKLVAHPRLGYLHPIDPQVHLQGHCPSPFL